MITEQYIREFFEKKERKNPLMLKTKYGRSLEQRYGVNERKAAEWLAQRSLKNQRLVGKS